MEKEKLINAIKVDKKERDERETFIKTSSYTWAYSGGYSVLLLIMLIRYISGEFFLHDLMMILMGQVGFMSLYIYIKNKDKKSNLFFTIFTLILFIGFTYSTLVHYELI